MFEKAEQRSQELEQSYALLDRWKNKSDELLYSMIPQSVADRLRAGTSPLSTCEVCNTIYVQLYISSSPSSDRDRLQRPAGGMVFILGVNYEGASRVMYIGV